MYRYATEAMLGKRVWPFKTSRTEAPKTSAEEQAKAAIAGLERPISACGVLIQKTEPMTFYDETMLPLEA